LDRRAVAFRERRRLVESPTQLRIVGEAPRDFGGGVAALELLLVLRRAVEPCGEAGGSDVVGRARFDRDEPLGRGRGLAVPPQALAAHSSRSPPSRRWQTSSACCISRSAVRLLIPSRCAISS
jgi:hypothetical protein